MKNFKIKRITVLIILIFSLNSSAFAGVDTIAMLPVLKNIFKGVADTTKAVSGAMSFQASTNGFGLNASVLTNKVSDVTSKWVPQPFQDNVKNVVGSCLNDLKSKLFKKIKWPSVNVCGHDIIADLKNDIDDYIGQINEKMNWTINGFTFVSSLQRQENTAFIKKTKKEMITDLQNIYNSGNIGQSGLKASIDNINNSHDSHDIAKKKRVLYDVLTHNETLQDIVNISKNIETLGVKFNSAVVASASKQKNESLHMDLQIEDTQRLSNQQINMFQNVLEYKRLHNLGVDDKTVDQNKITNVSLFDSYMILRDKNTNVKLPGTKGKVVLDLISSKIESLASVFQENSSLSSSSLDFSEKFFKEYYKYSDSKGISKENLDQFSYLTQAIKSFRDSMHNIKELSKNTSQEGNSLRNNAYLEGIMNLMLIQIAQDYQATKSTLNVNNINHSMEISLLKNISDKLRLLNYTNANLNTVLKP